VCGRESQRAQTDFDFGLKPCAASLYFASCLIESQSFAIDILVMQRSWELKSFKTFGIRCLAALIITRPLLRFAAGESLSLQLCFQGIKITRAAGACKRSLYRKRFRPRGNLVCGRESQRAQTDFDFGLKPCAASPCLRGSRRSSADQRRLRADLESLKNQAMRVSA